MTNYLELRNESGMDRRGNGMRPMLPDLASVISEITPLPKGALFLGVAVDGLPVLLNLHDSVPGPILIAGDAGTGKTDLLKTIANAAGMMHSSEDLQFGIVTAHPDEWESLERTPNNVGIFPTFDQSSKDFIFGLAKWAHENKTSGQSVVLLFDDLEQIQYMDHDTQQNLRYLLLRGPAHRVWPIVTINSDRTENMMPWLDAFQTKILGPVQNDRTISQLDAESSDANSLGTSQFTIREGNNWLRFWMPS